jgi:hypothetical protein
MRKRVGTGSPAGDLAIHGLTLSGTTTVSRVDVAVAALTKIARLPSRLKTTVFLSLPGMKYLPVIVIVSPMPRLSGEIFETVG